MYLKEKGSFNNVILLLLLQIFIEHAGFYCFQGHQNFFILAKINVFCDNVFVPNFLLL